MLVECGPKCLYRLPRAKARGQRRHRRGLAWHGAGSLPLQSSCPVSTEKRCQGPAHAVCSELTVVPEGHLLPFLGPEKQAAFLGTDPEGRARCTRSL